MPSEKASEHTWFEEEGKKLPSQPKQDIRRIALMHDGFSSPQYKAVREKRQREERAR
ncbi:MAG TPA: hypothetical protein VJB14_08530 [Planctomycetota bacterium]|nr:hypothetical protein [Planctomycetota bacterium]